LGRRRDALVKVRDLLAAIKKKAEASAAKEA